MNRSERVKGGTVFHVRPIPTAACSMWLSRSTWCSPSSAWDLTVLRTHLLLLHQHLQRQDDVRGAGHVLPILPGGTTVLAAEGSTASMILDTLAYLTSVSIQGHLRPGMSGTVQGARGSLLAHAGMKITPTNLGSAGSPLDNRGDHDVARTREKRDCQQKRTQQRDSAAATCTQVRPQRQARLQMYLQRLRSFPRTNLQFHNPPLRAAAAPTVVRHNHQEPIRSLT